MPEYETRSGYEVKKLIIAYMKDAIKLYERREFDKADDYSAVSLGLHYALADHVQRDFRLLYTNLSTLMTSKSKKWLAMNIEGAIEDIKKLRSVLY